MKPPSVCNVPGCPEQAVPTNGKCRMHRQKAKRAADRRNGRVRGSRWANVRRQVLSANPFCSCQGCESCEERVTPRGTHCIRPAVEVDHIIPLAHGGHATDLSNLQGLCSPCHTEKTRGEQHYALTEE